MHVLNQNSPVFLILLYILMTSHVLSGLVILVSRKLFGPFFVSTCLTISWCIYSLSFEGLGFLYLFSMLGTSFLALRKPGHFLNRYFKLFSVVVLLIPLLIFLGIDTNPHLSLALSHLIFAILIVTNLIYLNKRDQEALVMLAETQSLLADRKRVLEKTNTIIEAGNQNLERINKKVSLILDTANDAFFSMDDHGVILDWNRNAERLFEIKRSDAIGNKLNIILIPENYQKDLEADIAKSVSMPQEYVIDRLIEIKAFKPDGSEFPAEMSLSIFRYEGELTFNAFIRDITQRKKLEHMKDEFLSTVSHELRTPLAIVKGAVSNLKDGILGDLNEKQAKTIGITSKNISRLSKLINDLLDLSRLESGKATLNLVDLDIGRLLSEVTLGFNDLLLESKINFTLNIEPHLPLVKGDADMLVQVFTNILSNAQRYARRNLSITSKFDRDFVRVSISDDGDGISEENLQLLFSKFQQINRPQGGSGYKGTGLGLAICKEIIELHKGKIWAESTIGKGSVFHVLIPCSDKI